MSENRGETSMDEAKRRVRPLERGSKNSDHADEREPGAGGLSKAEYDEATKKAVKDIHG